MRLDDLAVRLFGRLAHRRAHSCAQVVDRGQAAAALDVPERPAVAGGQPLRQRADLVDRADGWTFWHVERGGRLTPIDDLRTAIRAAMRQAAE